MPEVMPLATLAGELERRLDAMEDLVADTRLMRFSVTVPDDQPKAAARTRRQRKEDRARRAPNPVTLAVKASEDGDEAWHGPINDHAQGQIAERLGLGTRFWDRMRDDHPDILHDTVEKLLEREHEVRMVRTLDGGVRAFLSNGYAPRDNYDLMNKAILPAIKEAKLEVRQCALTDTRLYIKVVFPDVQEEVEVGDLVQCGIIISNSEVGAGSTAVEPFAYRLLCKNGMRLPADFAEFGVRKHHLGRRIGGDDSDRSMFSERSLRLEDEAFFSMIYDVVSGSAQGVQFARIVDKLRDLRGLPTTGDPVGVVQRISRRERMTESERGSIMRHLIEGGDTTAYGYTNAVTRAAQEADRYDRQIALETVGGDMVAWSAAAWTELLGAREETK